MAENVLPAHHYLNEPKGWKSWLFTLDHKRIGILYLVGIGIAFALGGIFAILIRLELLNPGADIMSSDTYNKLFTLHGAAMIFLFIIPSIPAGQRCRLSTLEPRELVYLCRWHADRPLFDPCRRRRYGMDILHTLQYANDNLSHFDDLRGIHPRIFIDIYRPQFHCDCAQAACTWYVVV